MTQELDQELIDQLSDKLDDDRLIALLERAEQSEDPNGMLRDALAEPAAEPVHTQNGFSHLGLSVAECRYEREVMIRGKVEVHEVNKGWVVVWNGPNRTWYYGADLSRQHTMQRVAVGFKTQEQAQEACRQKAESMETVVHDVRQIPLFAFISPPENDIIEKAKTKKLQPVLSPRQLCALDAVTRGARVANERSADGCLVNSDTQALGLLLDKLADAMGLPQASSA